MAVKPKIKTITNSSPDVLNAIRNSASVMYKNYVPIATKDTESVRKIGAVIMDNPQLQNEFLNALVNRIGKVMLQSKMYSNPLAMFKKGIMEFGETIEEIFVNLAKPFTFDPEEAESEVFKREVPDVRSAFHVMNYQKFYKATVTQAQLKQAFLSWEGVGELIAGIVDSMYTGANYDEYQVMKYMLARRVLDGTIGFVKASSTSQSADPYKVLTTVIKATSNKMEFLSSDYNIAGVKNFVKKENQYLLLDSTIDANIDVNVLASAFNMDKAQFMGHKTTFDGFATIDNERLGILFADDDTYEPLTPNDLQLLSMVIGILCDKDYFMIFDNFNEFTEQYNGQGLYWNYWYHVWKTFSLSPYANACAFVGVDPIVTSVTVTPSTLTTGLGTTVNLKATVVASFASKAVTWSSSDEGVTVDTAGNVHISADADLDKGDTVTITATSVADDTETGTCVITIA